MALSLKSCMNQFMCDTTNTCTWHTTHKMLENVNIVARQTGNGIEFGTARTHWQGYRVRIRIRSSIVYKAIWKDWLLKWRQPHLLNAPPCDMYACMWLTVRCIEHWNGKPFTFSHRIHLYFHILTWIIWWNPKRNGVDWEKPSFDPCERHEPMWVAYLVPVHLYMFLPGIDSQINKKWIDNTK